MQADATLAARILNGAVGLPGAAEVEIVRSSEGLHPWAAKRRGLAKTARRMHVLRLSPG